MSDAASTKSASPTVLSLAQLLEQQPSSAPPCLVEPGLLPPQGILFVGGEPKVGKSLLVANLALSLAAFRIGFLDLLLVGYRSRLHRQVSYPTRVLPQHRRPVT